MPCGLPPFPLCGLHPLSLPLQLILPSLFPEPDPNDSYRRIARVLRSGVSTPTKMALTPPGVPPLPSTSPPLAPPRGSGRVGTRKDSDLLSARDFKAPAVKEGSEVP
ncbi:hypothetical protein T492DRAFT_837844 [Pavlovales sp. CCMP2436]|nr:hypothetical protein T492DRAFT_837844 [Pavlovales sp. CCMP2436]